MTHKRLQLVLNFNLLYKKIIDYFLIKRINQR